MSAWVRHGAQSGARVLRRSFIVKHGFIGRVAAVAAFGLMLLGPATTSAQSTLTLNGAGSSFDNPLFSKAFAEYTNENPGVQVNYQSVGSGAGIQQLTEKTVDFGATDAPMTDDQLTTAGGADAVVHIPVTLGAVAVTYNLPDLTAPLNIDGDTLAKIFLGTITKWNDPAIAALNSSVSLPDTDIAVVHRSDGSGTTNIFSAYLSTVSADWKSQVGEGLSIDWPTGIGAKGSDGVAGQVQQLEGGITYVELSYAQQNNIATANVENSSGAFVAPSAVGATACANAAASTLPDDLRILIAGCTGDDATIYPISGFSWVVLYKDQSDATRGQALVDVLGWLITDGQQYGADLSYAPLPATVVAKAQQALATVTSGGQALYTAPVSASPVASPAA